MDEVRCEIGVQDMLKQLLGVPAEDMRDHYDSECIVEDMQD